MKYCFYILFIIFFFSGNLLFASDFRKNFEKAQEKYHSGYYKQSKKSFENIFKSVSNDENKNDLTKVEILIMLAKATFSEDGRDLTETYTLLKDAEEICKKNIRNEYLAPVKLAEIALTYLFIGDIQKANALINDAKKSVKSFTNHPSSEFEVRLAESKILMNLGYFDQAHDLASSATNYQLSKIKKSYSIEKNGKTISKKYKKKDFRALQREYANHLNFLAEILIAKGMYGNAEKQLKSAEKWITQNISKSDLSLVDNYFLRAQIYHFSFRLDAAIKMLINTKKMNEKVSKKIRYLPSSYQYLEIQELLAFKLMQRKETGIETTGDRKQAIGIRNKYHINAYNSSSYQKENLFKLRSKLLEAKLNLADNRNERQIRESIKIINDLLNNENLSPNHPFRKELLIFSYEIHAYTDNAKKLTELNSKIDSLNDFLIPENTPVFHMQKMERAIHLYKYEDKYDLAASIFEKSFEDVITKHVYRKHIDYFRYINEMIHFYTLNDQFEKAEEYIALGINIAKEDFSKSIFRLARQYNVEANYYIERGLLKEATNSYLQAKKLYEQPNLKKIDKAMQKEVYGNILRTRVLLDIAQNDYDETKENIRNYRSESGANKDDHKDILDFAPFYIEEANYAKVKEILHEYEAYIIKNYTINNRRVIPIYLNLASIELKQGLYTEAEKRMTHLRKVIVNTFGTASLNYAKYLHLKGEINLAMGDYGDALKNFRQAIDIRDIYIHEPTLIGAKLNSLLALTELYDQEGELTFDQQKDLERRLKESMRLVRLSFGVTDQVVKKANEGVDEAQKMVSKLRRSTDYKNVIFEQLTLYLTLGKLNEAERLIAHTDSLNLNEEYKAQFDVINGSINQRQGNLRKALGFYTNALSKYKSLYGENHPEYLNVLGLQAQIYYMQGKISNAISILDETTDRYIEYVNQYFPYLSEKDKREFWFKKLQPDFEFYNTLAFSKPKDKYIKKVYDNILTTKAILLSSSLKVRQKILGSGDSTLIAIYQDWLQKQEVLTYSLSLNSEQLKAEDIDLDELQNTVQDLEKSLGSKSQIFKEQTKRNTYTWASVSKALKENEYAIEIIRYRYFINEFSDSIIYKALIIDNKSNAPKVVSLTDGNLLENKFKKYYRNAIKYKIQDDQSYNAFWKPIHEVVGDNSTIFLSPDGVYNEVNPESFLLPSGKYVIDQNNIQLISNTKDIVIARQNNNPIKKIENQRTALLMGNPAYYYANTQSASHENENKNQRIKQLLGAEEEIKTVASTLKNNGWNTDMILFENATEDTIKTLKDSPYIFHIATHGFFEKDKKTTNNLSVQIDKHRPQENPLLKSGLILKGGGEIVENNDVEFYNIESGVLTAYEAMNLNLDNTNLVILSACETGLGESRTGEGVYGLQRAFIQAGAENVIMSLFKVNDQVTKELMDVFYQNWLKTDNKRQSFIDAKKEIRSKYPEPIYWGAFVMIGK